MAKKNRLEKAIYQSQILVISLYSLWLQQQMCKKGLLSSSARRRNWRQANTTVIGSSQNRSGDDGSIDSRSAAGAPNSAGTGAPENGHAALKSPRLSSPGGPVVAGGPPNMGGRVGTSNFTTSLSIQDEDTSPVGLLNLKILAPALISFRFLLHTLLNSCTYGTF